ncbi:MAG: ornithine decarboxylase, partial [Burkholderiales bacterium]
GYKLLSRTLELASELRMQINSTKVFRVLELDDMLPDELKQDGIRLDPTKITLDISRSGYSVEEFQRELFEHYNIQVEKTTFNTLTLLLTIGTTRSKCSRLYDALMRIAREGRAPRKLEQMHGIPRFTELKYLPRDTYFSEGEMLPLLAKKSQANTALINRISADQIVPYPPGIPVLVPGQLITADILEYLIGLLGSQKHIELHGLVHDGNMPLMRVLTATEEKRLKKLC